MPDTLFVCFRFLSFFFLLRKVNRNVKSVNCKLVSGVRMLLWMLKLYCANIFYYPGKLFMAMLKRWGSSIFWNIPLQNTRTYIRVKCIILFDILFLTFRGPSIVIYSYSKSQRDALFLNFILVRNSSCFGQTYSPSSGVLILYSQHLVLVILNF